MVTPLHANGSASLSSESASISLPNTDGRTREEAHHDLLHTLFIELFQTERSADVHSRREAERFRNEPPGRALRAVAAHAQVALIEFSDLAALRGFSDTRGGMAIGSLFSFVRDVIADRVLDRERSYRGTLLGMRHGMDLVRSLGLAAEAADDTLLAACCARWIQARAPLVDRVADELAWFAKNPERALEGAKGAMSSRIAWLLGLG